MQQTIWKRHYNTLGRLLVAKAPEIAEELLQKYCLAMQPIEQDPENIPVLYARFCFIEKQENQAFKGPLYKSDKVEKRRLFIAAMLHLFQPQIFHQPKNDFILKENGFVRKLAGTLGMVHSHLSTTIREVMAHERVYESFKQRVDLLVRQLSHNCLQTNGREQATC